MLSSLSVSCRPESRLRHWCSSIYLRIPPLHMEFHSPLLHSRKTVSDAVPRLSRGLSHQTYSSACARFTPNKSGQRLPPTYYRGCWHVVSSCFLIGRSVRRLSTPPEFPSESQCFTTRRPSSHTRRCSVRVSPIAKYSLLLPPVGVWAVSQSQCGRLASQLGYASSPWWAFIPPTS